MAKGKAEETVYMVKNMLKEGLDINLISRISNLSIKEIQKIKDNCINNT